MNCDYLLLKTEKKGEGLRKDTWLGESRQENRLHLKFLLLI